MGHVPDSQLTHILVDAENVGNASPRVVDAAADQCEICQAFDNAPHVPVSAFIEEFQVDSLFLGDVTTLRAMVPYSKYSLLARVSSENTLLVWGAFADSWSTVIGQRGSFQMVAGEEGSNEVWSNFRAERKFRHQFQGKGASP